MASCTSFLISSTENLPSREWPPLEPPIPFPSGLGEEGGKDLQDMDLELGEMDLEDIPYDEPPQVKDYPVHEDQSHEVVQDEAVQRTREEL